jgi:hypothetical protein
MNCKWCTRPIKPRQRSQVFCPGGKCRHAYHSAARRYTEDALRDGYIDMETLRRRYSSSRKPYTPRSATLEDHQV